MEWGVRYPDGYFEDIVIRDDDQIDMDRYTTQGQMRKTENSTKLSHGK